jgi:hypothetical protein
MEHEGNWMTARQAQARLGVNERTLRKWAVSGKLCRVRGKDGRARFLAADVERLALERLSAPTSAAGPAVSPPHAQVAANGARNEATCGAGFLRPPEGEEPDSLTRSPEPGAPSCPYSEALEQARAHEQRLADAHARERQLLQEIQWLRSQLERLHDTQRQFCLLLLQDGRGPDRLTPHGLLADTTPARDYR